MILLKEEESDKEKGIQYSIALTYFWGTTSTVVLIEQKLQTNPIG